MTLATARLRDFYDVLYFKILIMQYSRNYKSDHMSRKYFEEEIIQQTLDYNCTT